VGVDQLRRRNAAALAGADYVASIKNLDVGSDGGPLWAQSRHREQFLRLVAMLSKADKIDAPGVVYGCALSAITRRSSNEETLAV
jgi:hypothetical protein